jgi:hypothetical protein
MLLNCDGAMDRGQRVVHVEHHRLRELAKILKTPLGDPGLPGRYRYSANQKKQGQCGEC